MDIVGLLMFSLSMAYLGLYQTVPFTEIRPTIDFPLRLRGAFRLGYGLGRLGQLLDMLFPPEEPEPMSTLPLWMFGLPSHFPTLTPEPVAVASVTQTHPQSAPGAPTAESTTIVIYQIVIMSLTGQESDRLADAETSIAMLVFTICGGALLCVVGATFLILYVAFVVCRKSKLKVERKVEQTNEDIDLLLVSLRTFTQKRRVNLQSTTAKSIQEQELAYYEDSLSSIKKELNGQLSELRGLVPDLYRHSWFEFRKLLRTKTSECPIQKDEEFVKQWMTCKKPGKTCQLQPTIQKEADKLLQKITDSRSEIQKFLQHTKRSLQQLNNQVLLELRNTQFTLQKEAENSRSSLILKKFKNETLRSLQHEVAGFEKDLGGSKIILEKLKDELRRSIQSAQSDFRAGIEDKRAAVEGLNNGTSQDIEATRSKFKADIGRKANVLQQDFDRMMKFLHVRLKARVAIQRRERTLRQSLLGIQEHIVRLHHEALTQRLGAQSADDHRREACQAPAQPAQGQNLPSSASLTNLMVSKEGPNTDSSTLDRQTATAASTAGHKSDLAKSGPSNHEGVSKKNQSFPSTLTEKKGNSAQLIKEKLPILNPGAVTENQKPEHSIGQGIVGATESLSSIPSSLISAEMQRSTDEERVGKTDYALPLPGKTDGSTMVLDSRRGASQYQEPIQNQEDNPDVLNMGAYPSSMEDPLPIDRGVATGRQSLARKRPVEQADSTQTFFEATDLPTMDVDHPDGTDQSYEHAFATELKVSMSGLNVDADASSTENQAVRVDQMEEQEDPQSESWDLPEVGSTEWDLSLGPETLDAITANLDSTVLDDGNLAGEESKG
ncbi:hypothetical protein VTO42DRAFT_1011 [Malbranchea cinnamomea]